MFQRRLTQIGVNVLREGREHGGGVAAPPILVRQLVEEGLLTRVRPIMWTDLEGTGGSIEGLVEYNLTPTGDRLVEEWL